jgi:hypothetical protein
MKTILPALLYAAPQKPATFDAASVKTAVGLCGQSSDGELARSISISRSFAFTRMLTHGGSGWTPNRHA